MLQHCALTQFRIPKVKNIIERPFYYEKGHRITPGCGNRRICFEHYRLCKNRLLQRTLLCCKSYIYLHAKVNLNMLFMNLGLFSNVVSEDGTEVEGELSPHAEIVYNGILGY